MFKKIGILIFCGAITLAASTVSFSQDTAKPADAAQPTDATAAPADAAQPADAARSVSDQPAAAGTNAEKAKQYSDGVNTYVNSKALFRLTSRDNFLSDKVVYKIDGGAETAYDKEFALTAEGKHTVSYFGVDKIGNKEDEKSFSVTVDNTAPEVTVSPKFPIYSANGKLYISKQFTFNIAATDALSGVEKVTYTVNGKDFVDYATAFSIYTDGDLTFAAGSLDNVANKSSKFKIKMRDDQGKETVEEKESIQLFADNIAPAVTIAADKTLTPVNGKNIASKEFKYAVTAADKESGVKMIMVRADGRGDFVPYEKEVFFNTNGDHYIEAKAIDAVGNVSDTVILSVYVDVVPPKTAIETIAE